MLVNKSSGIIVFSPEGQYKSIYNPVHVSCTMFPLDNSGQESAHKGLTLFLTTWQHLSIPYSGIF